MSTNEKRTAIWAFVKQKKRFTYMEVVNGTGINYSTIRSFIQVLVKQGRAKVRTKKKGCKAAVFKMISDVPPQLGSGARTGYRRKVWKKLNGASRCWRSMRVLKKFTTADIAQGGEVCDSYARQYVVSLFRAGYIRCLSPHISGSYREGAVYLLIKDTGPKNPIVRRRDSTVYDPNIDEVLPMNPNQTNRCANQRFSSTDRRDHVRLD